MADTVDSKSAVARRVGSSPTIRIYYLNNKARNPTGFRRWDEWC